MRNYILLGACISMLFGCAKEEDVTPSESRNMYDCPDFSSQEEMKLRRDFYKETGSFLLFNDSLGYVDRYTPQGYLHICEVLDLNYEVTSGTQSVFNFTYLRDYEKQQQVAGWLAKEVLPMLPAAWRPYAILLTDDFLCSEYIADSWSSSVRPEKMMAAFSTYYALIVGCNDVFDMDDEKKQAYKREVLMRILRKSLSMLDEHELTDFYQYSDAYYDTRYSGDSKEVGLLKGVIFTFTYYEKVRDLQSYVHEIFTMTEEEFTEKYAQWDLVLKKRDALVKILEKHGVKVY
ncbi:MAG: hypothetical protein K2O69_02485 [Odoribacter sp.]|nr:hypothetical protein [Odoribacter sp.]